MRWFLPLLVACLALSGCAQTDEADSHRPALRPTTPAATVDPPAESTHMNPPPVEPRSLRVEDATCDEVENGQGAMVTPDRCVRLVAVASYWPARALDPVLYVGEQRYSQYEYGDVGELIFHADGEALPVGEEVFIRYGDDDESFVLTNSLEVR